MEHRLPLTLRPLVGTAAIAAAALLGTGAATAGAAAPQPVAAVGHHALSLPPVIVGHTASLHPEGVAWDPTRHGFLVSSVRHGTVSFVAPDGTVRPFAADDRMVSTFGLHVDAVRGRVLVTFGDIGLGERSTPDSIRRSSGVGIFDLATGRLLHLVDLGTTPGPHGANDLAIDAAGNAYVTDVFSTELYRVDQHGRASVLAQDPRFAAASFGMNGIVVHPAGYVLAVNYESGRLFRIRLHGDHRVDEVALDRPLIAGDGMALRRDGTLVVVTNGLGGAGTDAIQFVRPQPGWSSANVGPAVAWPDKSPTTVALTPRGAYVVAGRLDALLAGQTADDFVLRRA
jgi:sugar lactone lactonase YvrE